MIIILALKALAALLSYLGRWSRAALFLAVSVASDLLRHPFAELRARYPKPYTGWGYALWLPDQALTILIPATLFGAVFGLRKGLALGLTAFALVALAYPTLRGENLLRAYWAVFGTVYLITSGFILLKSFTRKIIKEEALLVLFGLTGLGDILLIRMFGISEWWGVRWINGATYASAIGLSIFHLCHPECKLPVHSSHHRNDL